MPPHHHWQLLFILKIIFLLDSNGIQPHYFNLHLFDYLQDWTIPHVFILNFHFIFYHANKHYCLNKLFLSFLVFTKDMFRYLHMPNFLLFIYKFTHIFKCVCMFHFHGKYKFKGLVFSSKKDTEEYNVQWSTLISELV